MQLKIKKKQFFENIAHFSMDSEVSKTLSKMNETFHAYVKFLKEFKLGLSFSFYIRGKILEKRFSAKIAPKLDNL
jgi:hypothetical protein